MDSRLLGYYERELRHLRESANEFAIEFPKIAGRLGLPSTDPIPDPYVERLLEGFAYLTSRVQLKLDAEFPRFTQHLLESVYPHYLSPMPSMCIAQVTPDLDDAALDLPAGEGLVDDAADLLSCMEIDDADLARAQINLDGRNIGRPCEGGVGIALVGLLVPVDMGRLAILGAADQLIAGMGLVPGADRVGDGCARIG